MKTFKNSLLVLVVAFSFSSIASETSNKKISTKSDRYHQISSQIRADFERKPAEQQKKIKEITAQIASKYKESEQIKASLYSSIVKKSKIGAK